MPGNLEADNRKWTGDNYSTPPMWLKFAPPPASEGRVESTEKDIEVRLQSA